MRLAPGLVGLSPNYGLPIGPLSVRAPALLDLQFAAGGFGLGGRVYGSLADVPGYSFTRASAGYAQTAGGVLVPFASGAPRITDLGILVEEARQNKNTNTNVNPANTTGLSGGGVALTTVVDDSAALAAIGLTGNAFKCDNSGGGGSVFINFEGVPGNTNKHSFSIYWRGGNGAIDAGAGPTGVTGTGAYVRIKIENATPATSSTRAYIRVDAGQTVYFILNSFEEGAFCTSPIATAGSAVTRAADVARIGSLVVPSAVTVVASATSASPNNSGAAMLFSLDDGSSNNRVQISWSAIQLQLLIVAGGATQVANIGTWSAGPGKTAVAYSAVGAALAVKGAINATSGAITVPTQNRLCIGSDRNGGAQYNGYIDRLMVIGSEYSQAQLQGITA
jgi:hypothetical protein